MQWPTLASNTTSWELTMDSVTKFGQSVSCGRHPVNIGRFNLKLSGYFVTSHLLLRPPQFGI